MIGNITRGDDFRELATQLYEQIERPGALPARSVAYGGTLIIDPSSYRSWLRDMMYMASLNRKVRKPVWRCALRTAPHDPLLHDDEWGQIARSYAAQMDFGGYTWVAVRNHEEMVHFVACRVSDEGGHWDDRFSYHRSMAALRRIERCHRLTVVDDTYRPPPGDADYRPKRTVREPKHERVILHEHLVDATYAARAQGWAAFETELDRCGVDCRFVTGHDGEPSGYEVTLPGWTVGFNEQIWLQATEIDQQFSWSALGISISREATSDV